MISKTSVQIIKALLELAKLPQGEAEGVASIAHKIQAPQNYLGKVLQGLVRGGFVISQKGLKGGFRLARASADINLYEVVGSLEDIKRWEGCFMGRPSCSEATACCMHKRWENVRRVYIDFLKNTTIADLKEK